MARRIGLLLALPLLLSCGSPIVGAECQSGLSLCDGRCVDLESDSAHCGSCGESCGDLTCNAGSCGPDQRADAGGDGGRPDAGPAPDGGMQIDGGRMPPTQGRGNVGAPFLPAGGFEFPDDAVADGCSIGETACGSACAVLSTSHEHCGECGRACAEDQFCADGECVDLCEAPLRACGGSCVSVTTDERNCGDCGVVCRSGLCEDAACADVVPGHLVVIGHDYLRLPNPTMQHVAGNALFLANGSPVRALVYRGTADERSVFGVNDAITVVVPNEQRQWSQVAVDPDQLSSQLIDADALLIHAQDGASDAELIELGQRWGLSMTQFLLRGGVIVLFETLTESNAGTFQLLEPAGLFAAAGRAEIPPRRNLSFVTPGVGVARRTIATYQSQTTTVQFLDVTSPGMTAVEGESGEAVVVHRVVVP